MSHKFSCEKNKIGAAKDNISKKKLRRDSLISAIKERTDKETESGDESNEWQYLDWRSRIYERFTLLILKNGNALIIYYVLLV